MAVSGVIGGGALNVGTFAGGNTTLKITEKVNGKKKD